jgi:NAD(P)H dehydrogenase (quinone)
MAQTEVLITFYSQCGSTEKLALAAAVGAVQARAQIRFRRLPDIGDTSTSSDSPECRKVHERLRKEYVAPSEADVLRADAIIFVAPSEFRAVSPEWTEHLDLIEELRAAGKLNGKVAAAIQNDAGQDALARMVLRLGFIVVPDGLSGDGPARALVHGRRTAEVATALKKGV